MGDKPSKWASRSFRGNVYKTGIGALTPLGNNLQDYWQSLKSMEKKVKSKLKCEHEFGRRQGKYFRNKCCSNNE